MMEGVELKDGSYNPMDHLLEGCAAENSVSIDKNKLGTPWRDPGGRVRGERFTKPVVRDTSPVTKRTTGDGRATYFRGTGFYGGMGRSI